MSEAKLFARVTDVLAYDQTTGEFRWKADIGKVRQGVRAGCVYKSGYRYIQVDGRGYRAGRLALLYVTGKLPAGEADHINRDRGDDRIENLRDVSHQQNLQNRGGRYSGSAPGVYCNRGRWVARVTSGGVRRHVGQFATRDEAVRAWALAIVDAG